jgi:hypothetical protein
VQQITITVFDFDELSEPAQARAIEVLREKLAGPLWDDDDIDAVQDAIVHALAEKLGTVGASRHGPADFTGIRGVRLDGWDLERQHSIAVSGILDRDNAAALPWVDGLDHVELSGHRSHSTEVTVQDATAECTCSADHYLLPHDDDCPSLGPPPVTADQRDALEDAVRDGLCAAWTAGEREAESRTGEERARAVATDYQFTEDGELYP